MKKLPGEDAGEKLLEKVLSDRKASRKESGKKEEIPTLHDASIRKPVSDIRLFRALIHKLGLEGRLAHLKVYVPKIEGKNLAVAEAFPGEVIILRKTEAGAEKLRTRGYTAERGYAQTHTGEHADVVVVLDKSLKANPLLLRNVAVGGYLFCHREMASAVRRLGTYKFKGFVEKGASDPIVESHVEEMEVKEEEEFKKATDNDSGAVTYSEAREVVKKAFGSDKHVLERYKELIAEAKARYGERVSDRLPVIEYEFEKENGEVVGLSINTILPVREDNRDKVFAFRKLA